MNKPIARAAYAVFSIALASVVAGCGDDSSTGSGGGGEGTGGATATTDASASTTVAATTASTTGASTTGASTTGGEGGAGVTTGAGGAGGAGEGGAAPLTCEDGPALGESAECVTCQAESCCVNAEGCLGDAACAATDACTEDGGSFAECANDNPDAIWYLSGVIICRENNCPEECGAEPAECGNIIPTPASCTEDVQAACCEETAACGANDSCVALIYQCIDAEECTTQACFLDCLDRYPDGEDDFLAMADCWGTVECL